jgi:hypothetical protein
MPGTGGMNRQYGASVEFNLIFQFTHYWRLAGYTGLGRRLMGPWHSMPFIGGLIAFVQKGEVTEHLQ